MRSSPHEARGCGFRKAPGSGVMTIGSVSGVPTAMAPSSTTNATRESPLIAVACATVAFSRKPLSAAPHVVENVPPYVDVRLVAVATTTGSGPGSVTTAIELESRAIADIVAVAAEPLALTGVAAGAGSAIGLRSVVDSTTTNWLGIGVATV